MAAGQSGFFGTPGFELFRRALTTQTIKRFRGINVYQTLTQLGPEWAQDCLNVLVSGSGGLSKMRLPINLSPAIGGQATGPNGFWDFQQGNGTRQVVAAFGASLYYFTNDLANVTLIENNALNNAQWDFRAANQILFGVNGLRAMKWTGANWWGWGHNAPLAAPAAPGVIAGALSPATGFTYSYAYKNSVTGHCGNRSAASSSTAAQAAKAFTVLAIASTDAQIDTIVWFRTLDGGGDQFKLCEVNINTGAITNATSGTSVAITGGTGNLGITDNTPDSGLDQTIKGPLINNPPIIGKYLAVGQNRVAIFNLVGAPQDFIYSGYEQIFFGRPEESFPPSNRIRLSIGAESIAGGGILQAGVVAFSQTGRMFMVRGALQDIVLSQPVSFSSFMEELPWTLGCLSHYTIQSTPYGLIWLAGDKTVQLFNGHDEPDDLSVPVYPYLRRITPGTESQAVGAYFNWLERDWYALIVALDGSLTPNKIFFWALDKKTEDVEIFVSDIPPGSWIGTITTSKLQRLLCIAQGGRIQQLPVTADTVAGITQDLTIIPPTAGNLNAFWRGGYFGNDSPQRSKIFRFMRLVADPNPQAFKAMQRYVDDEGRTLQAPEIIGPIQLAGSRLGMNHRAKRAAIEINFPQNDVSANVLELQVAHIATSDR